LHVTRTLQVGLVADGYHDFTGGSDGAGLTEQARHAAELGFTHFALSDHLHSAAPTFDPWTALTWVAAATSEIAIVSDVLGLPYRPPAVLAKMAESLQRLSGGRLVLGLGNGGYDREFAAFGLSRRTPGEKVDALGEAIILMRRLWTEPAVTVDGQHYRADAAEIRPHPPQPIPIWLGAYGTRSLAQAGALADGWLPSLGRATVDQLRGMRATVREAAERAGRDPDAITYACNVFIEPGGIDASLPQLHQLVDSGFDTLLIAGLSTASSRDEFAGRILPELPRPGQ
jgi:alkanesulfonate monooxygenase SsuD/methylene tetrahydromethanopterin reductase-like flavin-dependent oxidoreductase (luciferase family)